MTSARSHAGFTLIEVLMGVLVLGLGLLGLAAVFPAVVVQQRQASDAVLGEVAANSAESLLRGTDIFSGVKRDAGGVGNPGSTVLLGLFPSLALDTGTNGLGAGFSIDGSWAVAGDPASGILVGTADYPGGYQVDLRDSADPGTVLPVETAVALRVFPAVKRTQNNTDAEWRAIADAGDEPRFVWDIAVRRKLSGQTDNTGTLIARTDDTIEAAIFVRRIDPGIRLPGASQTLSRVLSQRGAQARVIPVGEDANARPSRDGTGTYSSIRVASIDAIGATTEAIITGLPDALLAFAAQPGQKLLIGTEGAEVFEVQEGRLNAGGGYRVRLDRVIPESFGTTAPMLFTIHIPAAIKVVSFQ